MNVRILSLYILLSSFCFGGNTFAQPVQVNHRDNSNYDNNETGSALTVFSETGDPFFLMINGVKQNYNPQSRVRVEGLPQVYNDIVVTFTNGNIRPVEKQVNFSDPVNGKAISLVIGVHIGRDGDAKLKFFKSAPLEMNYNPDQNEYRMSYGRDNYNQGGNNQIVQNNNYTPPPPPPGQPVVVQHAIQPMDDGSFNNALNTIASSNFEDSKLSTAKSIAGNNYFTVNQVVQICNQFGFDQSKFEFAKFAYKRTVDPNNYFMVNNVFQFDNYKEQLNDYVNHNR